MSAIPVGFVELWHFPDTATPSFFILTVHRRISDFLNNIYQSKPDSILILGDFNDKCLQWNSNHTESELKNNFVDLIEGNNLHQMINEPTHIKETSASLLDLIITDSPNYVLNAGTWAPIGDPYHSTIFCRFHFLIKQTPKYKREIWKLDNCDFKALNENLSNAPWYVLESFDSVNDALDYFYKFFFRNLQDPHHHINCNG